MKQRFVALFAAALLSNLSLLADQDATYQFNLDLTKVNNDQLSVELVAPKISQSEIIYHMPAMVPGTYAVYNFGRFTSDFHAYDASGKELTVANVDVNSWKISDATKLYRIRYNVEDTWDTKSKDNVVFEPGGTNIQADSNFVINTHGFFGYFDGMKRSTYVVNVTKPSGFFGSTGLSNIHYNGSVDTYTVSNYMDLVDGPIMYCRPDTTHLMVGGADVLISVYSPRGMVKSKFIAETINPLLDAQRQYLGGTLPVKNYAFLIYLSPSGYKSGAFGALEHSYSSFYCLLEMEPSQIAQTVRDVAAHEFFHIVTPLSIHSEEIGDFDYNKPKMSQHLWMYEGLTEYAASHVQIKNSTMKLDEYLGVISGKMAAAAKYNERLSFTEMSKGALDTYKDQYDNVYSKGALIGLCLDIRLRQLSGGKYGTQELMRDLAKTYGKDKSFKDDDLIPQIVKLTYPEIEDFFKKYVQGGDPLPFKEMLNAVGIDYIDKEEHKALSLGGFDIGLNPATKTLVAVNTDKMNEFGRKMGYKEGDEIVKFNGTELTLANARDLIGGFMAKAKAGDKLVIEVRRTDAKGKTKTKKLKGKMQYVTVTRTNILTPMESPTPDQLQLRKAWINQ